MTFADVVLRLAQDREFLAQYDRLRGTNLLLRGSPLDREIDLATGRTEAEVAEFIVFVLRVVSDRMERGRETKP